MRVVILLIVAFCCVAAVKANSSDIKSVKIKVITTSKVDQKDIKNQNDSQCDKNQKEETEKERKEKEKENERKEKELEKERKQKEKENERKEKELEKERKEKEKENERKEKELEKERKQKEKENERKEKECKEKDNEHKGKESCEHKGKEEKHHKGHGGHKGGKNDKHCEGDRSKERHNHDHKKPCGKPTKPICNTICALIADPLCATPDGFDGDAKTFDNECQLNLYNCQNPKAKYKKTSAGPCKPNCPEFCPYYVKPFCTLPDGWCGEPISFGNPCFLAVNNCKYPNKKYKYFHDGECITTPAPEPECGLIDCPQIEKPLCTLPKGFCAEPKTFINKCYLEVYNCFNSNEQYEYFHDGACITTPAPEPECGLIDCPQIEKPLCTLPKGFCAEPKTFINKCYLEVYNCFNSNEQYEYFHDGACITTPAPEPECIETVCPDEKSPICGLPDGFCGEPKTFANECYRKIYNTFNPDQLYKYFHDGECIVTETEPNCAAISCSNEGPAICGLPDGFCGPPQTFTNGCNMKVYNCFNPTESYKYFHDGECIVTETEPNCAAISCSNEGPAICGLPDGFCGPPQTFTNGCNMKVYNCFNPTESYKYFHDGECIVTETEPNCAAISCSNEGPAICGLPDGFCGPPQTFTNGCNMKVYNCFKPTESYKYFHDGECIVTETEPNCAAISCSNQGPAICGLPDGFCGPPQTFTNGCNMNVHNCFNPNQKYKKFHDGNCLTDVPNPPCPTMCPAIYKPVCTLPDGFCGEPKTYSSSCVLSSYNCVNPNQKYKYFHEGECKPKAPVCPTVCPLNYVPVCAAGQSGNVRTFSNDCEFSSYNGLNENNQYTFAHEGECVECSDIKCNKIYQPVCATSGKKILTTFGNPCQLQQHNCDNCNDKYDYAYDDECIEPVICTKEYFPVCAISPTLGSKTFANKCERDSYIGQHPHEGYAPAYEGKCKEQCQLGCPKNLDPLCGTDCNGKEQTFSNQCEFEKYNCLNPNNQYTEAYRGECNNCNVVCFDLYDPVCTLDSLGNEVQYSNQCELDSYNCRNKYNQHIVEYQGECHKCAVACIQSYEPICSADSNGNEKQYSNQCELDSYNCRYPNDLYSVKYDGVCNNCKVACPRIYRPVCTYDSSGKEKQYSNQCELDSYNCRYPDDQSTVAYNSECNNCNTACLDIYAPVCTYDSSGEEKQFSNQCELVNYNCQHKNDQHSITYEGECHQCNTACIQSYEPVCSRDSAGNEKTWGNQCELDSYNCRYPYNPYSINYAGACNNCKVACPRIYLPVCTYDSSGKEKQFANQCEWDSYNCRYPDDKCTLAYNSECNNCKTACNKMYAPVCCSDSTGKEQQFSNQCELDNYNCQHKNNQLSLTYDGECHQCNTMCIQIYDPVCSKDSAGNDKTWGNQCEFASYNCRYPYNIYTLQYKGECKASCLKPCPKNIAPICGKDKKGNTKTFNNPCEMDNYNCEHPDEKYTKLSDGKCKPECQDICPTIYKPVCGSPNSDCNNSEAQTFSNQCAFESYNCHNPTKLLLKAAEGECPVNCKKLKCTKEEKWICATPSGSNGKPSSFYNNCERLLHNCNNPKNKYDFSHDGKCDNGC